MNWRDITLEEIAKFHGHTCPGLALGYRMTRAALEALDGDRPADEELVAITENDSCAVDALQYLSSCTFGKGNMIFRDYGKMVFTFYLRKSGKAVRVCSSREQDDKKLEGFGFGPGEREKLIDWMLNGPAEEVYKIEEIELETPEKAKLIRSVRCSVCGELAMETRARVKNGEIVCIPCFEKEEA